MSALRDPELDPIARQIDGGTFSALSAGSRMEALKIAAMRAQTAAIEAQTKVMEKVLARLNAS